MNLKKSLYLFFALVASVCFYSCGNDNTATYGVASADAQIYGLSLSCIPRTSGDTINFPILATTKFVIDNAAESVYNPDSLPYRTNVKKYYTKLTLSPSSTPAGISLLYVKDSVAAWNSSDSIDYNGLIGFKITAADGTTSKPYKFELRIHTVDQDTIPWRKLASLAINTNNQKTLLKGDDFYCYSLSVSSLALNTYNKKSGVWTSKVLSNAPSGIKLESLALLNNNFYAVNNSGQTFSSTNGTTWTASGGTGIHSILGILPAVTGSDKLLVVVKSGSDYNYATTANMKDFKIMGIVGDESKLVTSNFPSTGFSSTEDYGKEKMLVLTGGTDFKNKETNLTWAIKSVNDDELAITNSQRNDTFKASPGVVNFIYDNKLYALIENQFYTSTNWGGKWTIAPDKQKLDGTMPKTSGQTVIVDSENYIWIFGGISGGPVQVWKGRLNKLNPRV